MLVLEEKNFIVLFLACQRDGDFPNLAEWSTLRGWQICNSNTHRETFSKSY